MQYEKAVADEEAALAKCQLLVEAIYYQAREYAQLEIQEELRRHRQRERDFRKRQMKYLAYMLFFLFLFMIAL